MIYLNQAGTSWPKPRCVRSAATTALDARPDTWDSRLVEDHRQVARAFGIADPDRLLLTPGATSALSVAISDHPWQSGDAIVISGLEHHALHRSALALAERGVEVLVAPSTDGAPVCLDFVERALRGGRVRMLAMTHACNVTGDLLPAAALVELAHRYGALALLDAAQTAGWLPLDVTALGVDLLAFAGHKGPHGLWGIGGLYVAPGLEMASPRGPMPGFCDTGSVDRPALAGLAAGLAWMGSQAEGGALAAARRRVERLRSVLLECPGTTLWGASAMEARMPTLAFRAAQHSPAALAAALGERGLVVSSGMQCAPLAHETLGTSPEGVVRLSVGPLLGDDAIDEARHALAEVLHG